MKHGTSKAKSIVAAVMKGEMKTAWGLVTEAFDFAGDTAIFVEITKDAQNPIYKASVATIFVPVCAEDNPACPRAYIAWHALLSASWRRMRLTCR